MPIGSVACAANVVAAISESAMPRLDLTRLDPNRIIVTTPCLVISDAHEGVPRGRNAAAGRVRYEINQVGSVTCVWTTIGNRRGGVIEWCFFSAAMQNTGRNVATCARNRRVYAASKFDLAQIDAFPKFRFDGLLLAVLADLDHVGAGAFLELVELEVAVVVTGGLRHQLAILQKLHARAFNTVDYAARLGRYAAADEAGRIAPEVAVVDPRLAAELRPHHLEALLVRHAGHLVVLELHRAHGTGRAGLVAAGLLPALIDEVRVERPMLRHLEFLVPPDVPIRTGVNEVLAALGALLIDQNDAVVALTNCAIAFGDTGRIIAVIAHGRNVGDVDHRHLPAFLLQNVDPLVAVLGHRLGIARPVVADILVHGRERAELAVRALGDIDDHVPFFHSTTLGICRVGNGA